MTSNLMGRSSSITAFIVWMSKVVPMLIGISSGTKAVRSVMNLGTPRVPSGQQADPVALAEAMPVAPVSTLYCSMDTLP